GRDRGQAPLAHRHPRGALGKAVDYRRAGSALGRDRDRLAPLGLQQLLADDRLRGDEPVRESADRVGRRRYAGVADLVQEGLVPHVACPPESLMTSALIDVAAHPRRLAPDPKPVPRKPTVSQRWAIRGLLTTFAVAAAYYSTFLTAKTSPFQDEGLYLYMG